MRLYPALVLVFAFCYANSALAQFDAPIRIHAGSIQVNQKNNKIIYRGKVKLRQGNMTIMADKVISKTRHGKVLNIIATGSPVRVHQIADTKFRATTLQAQRLEYTVAERLLVMSGSVQVDQELDTLRCERVEYQVQNRILNATAKSQQRIHAKFMPRRDAEVTLPPGPPIP